VDEIPVHPRQGRTSQPTQPASSTARCCTR
jgi:hypothetical protein